MASASDPLNSAIQPSSAVDEVTESSDMNSNAESFQGQSVQPPTDKPLPSPYTQQPVQNSSHKPQTNGTNGSSHTDPKQSDYHLRFKVHAVDRNRKDMLIKFDADTNLSGYRQRAYRGIQRSYTEYERYYEHLFCANPECIIPALPIYTNSASTEEESDHRFRHLMQMWMSRIAEDVVLMRDTETQAFIEMDFGYQPMQRLKRRTKTGITKALSFSKTSVDDDEELSDARAEATRLEATFGSAFKAAERLVKARKGIASCSIDLGSKAINYGSAESHVPLANGLKKLGRQMQVVGDIQMGQAIMEATVLSDYFAYAAANAHAYKETLTTRLIILSEYQTSVKTTVAKRRTAEKLKSATNLQAHKVDDALADLEEAQRHEQHLSGRLATITRNLRESVDSMERPRTRHDVLSALKEHARKSLSLEKQILKDLEALQPELKAITSRGMTATYLPIEREEATPYTQTHARTFSNSSVPQVTAADAASAAGAGGPPLTVAPTAAPSTPPSSVDPLGASTVMSSSPSTPRSSLSQSVLFGTGSMRRTNAAARSVYVPGHDEDKVDAKMAASTLANMF